MKSFGRFLLMFGFSMAAIYFQMNVAIKLWQWIAVPMGAAPIDILHAFGLSFFIGLFSRPSQKDDSPRVEEIALLFIIWTFINSFVLLGLGYLFFG